MTDGIIKIDVSDDTLLTPCEAAEEFDAAIVDLVHANDGDNNGLKQQIITSSIIWGMALSFVALIERCYPTAVGSEEQNAVLGDIISRAATEYRRMKAEELTKGMTKQ